MVIVQTTTKIVAASGIEASTAKGQYGPELAQTHISRHGGISSLGNLFSFSGNFSFGSIMGFQGPGSETSIITRKLQDNLSSGLVYSNVIQNSSFELGRTRWSEDKSTISGSSHLFNIVAETPAGVGFDNAPVPIDIPHGSRMLHTAKDGEAGYFSVFQDVPLPLTSTASLRNFEFSVAPDSAFTSDFSDVPPFTPGRYGLVALEFKLAGSTIHTLAYSFTGSETPPSVPPSFPSIDTRINLNHPGSDFFVRFTRNLPTDLSSTFDFDEFKIWIVPDMIDTLFDTTFDTLWDWFVLEVGVLQPALFPTSIITTVLSTDSFLTSFAVQFSVLGTVDSVEKFFDTSQIFFESETEADSNTIRDLSPVEPFMLFSRVTLFSYEFARNNPSSTILITDKAEEFSSTSTAPTNLITNHDFGQGFSSWQTTPDTFFGFESGEPWVEVLSSTNATAHRDIISPNIFPTQGSFLLFADVGAGSRAPGIFQDVNVNGLLDSLDLEAFGVDVAVGQDAGTDLSFVLQFFLEGTQVYQFTYTVDGLDDASTDSAYNFLGLSSVDTAVLTPALSESTSNPGSFTSLKGQLSLDTKQASFNFDQVKIYALFGAQTAANELVFDNFFLTTSRPPAHLRSTSGPAHVNTSNPVSSGIEPPLTVSGSTGIDIFDALAPFFDETVPASGTTAVPENTSVAFHIKDLSSNLDTGNLDVWISGEQVITASVPIATATWPSNTKQIITPRDISYEFFRAGPFSQGVLVTVSGELTDLADPVSNQSITDYSFLVVGSGGLLATISGSEDGTPPVLSPVEPLDLATQVSPNTDIIWSTTDNAAGVDPTTIRLYLNGALKVDGIDLPSVDGLVAFSANSSRGYDVTYEPDTALTLGQTVTGTLEAFDLADTPNFTTTAFEFTITPATTLEIVNFFMIPNETTLLTSGTLLSVEAVDFTHGVASGTTFLTVNGVVPSGLVTTYSGLGPDRIVFELPLEPLIDFRQDLNVLVHAENKFPGNFPVIKEESYILSPGYEVIWHNSTEDQIGGSEVTFPFITNIQVLLEAKNYAKNFGVGSEFFRYFTEPQSVADLGAYLESNIKTADLAAVLVSDNPFFEYGKEITVEIEADDFEGNPFRFTHTFKIESKP